MNWDALGAVGEMIGAVAVVITLLYVARQIHQVNAQTQASARFSLIKELGELNLLIAGDKSVASVFRRGLSGEQLDDDERLQFFTILGQFLNISSVLFDLHDDGLLPQNQWLMMRKDIISIFSEPGGRTFWDEVGRVGVHSKFSDAVEEILASDEASYKIA
jgi:hypothetical protein